MAGVFRKFEYSVSAALTGSTGAAGERRSAVCSFATRLITSGDVPSGNSRMVPSKSSASTIGALRQPFCAGCSTIGALRQPFRAGSSTVGQIPTASCRWVQQ